MADAEQLKTQQPWAELAGSIGDGLDVDREQGLSKKDADARQAEIGKNQLGSKKEKTFLDILIEQFTSLIVLLLVIAAALSFLFGDAIEGFSIIGVILINAAIGFFTEYNAVRSMAVLKEMTQVTANVFVWLAVALCIVLLLAVYVPLLANLLSLADPGLTGWALIMGASLAPMILNQVLKEFKLVK